MSVLSLGAAQRRMTPKNTSVHASCLVYATFRTRKSHTKYIAATTSLITCSFFSYTLLHPPVDQLLYQLWYCSTLTSNATSSVKNILTRRRMSSRATTDDGSTPRPPPDSSGPTTRLESAPGPLRPLPPPSEEDRRCGHDRHPAAPS